MSAPAEVEQPPDERQRDLPLGVVMVGMAAVAWWPAFMLGAWGEVFFDDILQARLSYGSAHSSGSDSR